MGLNVYFWVNVELKQIWITIKSKLNKDKKCFYSFVWIKICYINNNLKAKYVYLKPGMK